MTTPWRICPGLTREMIDGSVCSYFSDHFTRQLKAGAMVQDYLGLCPKPSRRIEGGGATGGLCFQSAWEAIASGRMEVCLAMGFETMSRVNTWKGNEFIALASDTNFDYPVGGFYTGYYAMMVQRHMHEFGTTVEQMAMVAVKNHRNALHNPYAQSPAKLTIEDVRSSPMVSTPLTILDCCQMSDGAAVAILASEKMAQKLCSSPVRITGVGSGTDAMRMADRPHGKVILLPHESAEEYEDLKYPGVHSFRAGRTAAKLAYSMAGISRSRRRSWTSSSSTTHTPRRRSRPTRTWGSAATEKAENSLSPARPFCRTWITASPSNRDRWKKIPVNPSGGLLACGHPVGATGLMQAVFAFWQLQGTIGKHLKDDTLQVPNAKRGLIHSHAGTGTYITVTILEKA